MSLVTDAATDTLPKLLRGHARSSGRKPGMREKDRGIWQTHTWSECYGHVRDFARKVLKVCRAGGEFRELGGVIGAQPRLPVRYDTADAVVKIEQTVGKRLRCRGVAREVDASRLHHHCINEAIGAIDIMGAGLSRLELVG